ncbi:hypothetical protein C469_03230 [Halorubrum lipolyticum DSM 21995]|uniref:Uncharacterized protein n=1 Tax=Halorubrum lipolyticum DSM 21995 TaxID=1227482 RepID=M0NZW1_9EURY|nr:hypothetical protein C469_03230 [Halorubrum lipolyticum DSM 21995]
MVGGSGGEASPSEEVETDTHVCTPPEAVGMKGASAWSDAPHGEADRLGDVLAAHRRPLTALADHPCHRHAS